jgi:hypothetical protein
MRALAIPGKPEASYYSLTYNATDFVHRTTSCGQDETHAFAAVKGISTNEENTLCDIPAGRGFDVCANGSDLAELFEFVAVDDTVGNAAVGPEHATIPTLGDSVRPELAATVQHDSFEHRSERDLGQLFFATDVAGLRERH